MKFSETPLSGAYLVVPERPPGTDGLAEDELAALVTRDAMIGVARVASPDGAGRVASPDGAA